MRLLLETRNILLFLMGTNKKKVSRLLICSEGKTAPGRPRRAHLLYPIHFTQMACLINSSLSRLINIGWLWLHGVPIQILWLPIEYMFVKRDIVWPKCLFDENIKKDCKIQNMFCRTIVKQRAEYHLIVWRILKRGRALDRANLFDRMTIISSLMATVILSSPQTTPGNDI